MIFNKIKMEGLRAIKIVANEGDKTIGRVYLYLINNDLHKEPYGLMEDVFVNEDHRGKGVGRQLIESVVEEAKNLGCTKLIAQSRYSRPDAHEIYEKAGFRDYGKNFRMDFNSS